MLVPWKKRYDQPRQHIKKQKHYFAKKGAFKSKLEGYEGFHYSSVGKESVCNAEDPGSIPGSGRYPGE